MKCVLADIADVTMGQSPKSEYYNSEKNGMPFLQGNRTFGKKYPTFDTYTTFITKTAKSGDVIMSVRAPVGDVNITPIDMCLGRGVCGIRMKNENQEFLFYLLKYYMPRLVNKQSGTVFGSVNKNDINSLEIDIPEDSTIQRKIARYLSMIDEKIELNEKINKNLLQQAQALFISWFVDYAPFGGKMPDNWENMSVYELADYINGAAFKKNEYADTGIPIIKIAELKNGITDSTQRCCVKKDEKYYIDDRDILFSWSGNPDTSIDTFIWSRGRAILNQHTFRVVSKYDAPAFTFFLLKYLKPQFTHIASNKQTTGLGHVTVADLKRLQFRANASVIAEFDAFVMPMFDLIYSKYKEIHQLSNLRDTLLPKLMSGEIDVSNLEL